MQHRYKQYIPDVPVMYIHVAHYALKLTIRITFVGLYQETSELHVATQVG